MVCCPNCFRDNEVISFITTNSTEVGTCDFCKAEGVPVVNPAELQVLWLELFQSYAPIDNQTDNSDAKSLLAHLKEWNLFKEDLQDQTLQTLIEAIGGDFATERRELFTGPSIPRVFADGGSQQQVLEYDLTWARFKEEIKHVNRFFIQNIFESRKIRDILTVYEKWYHRGKLFYRARYCDVRGRGIDEMGKPPADNSTPGRANPKGISYLYLANNKKTTLYEVRAAIHDYIAVGIFELQEEIKIVSLRTSERISPFQLVDKIDNYLLHERFVQSLHNDLRKPLRRHDTELEYLPTQYLCELIKYLGYDGVEYSSSMNPEGFNLALFNDNKIRCTNVEHFEVKSLEYQYENLQV